MRFLYIAIFIFGISFNLPAYAQSKKELSAQNAALAQRISALERRMLTGDPAAERLIQRMDGLETSQRNLTGENERLRFENETLRKELTALIEDMAAMQMLTSRMKVHLDAVDLVAQEQAQRPANSMQNGFSTQPRIYGEADSFGSVQNESPNFNGTIPDEFHSEGSTQLSQVPSAPTFKEVTIPVQENYNDVSKLPELGQQKLAEGDFLGAQTSFRQYLEVNPNAADAGDVNFWLAETYFVRGGYTDAADYYIASMRKAPDGPKAPDAMVGLAATLRQLGKTVEACDALASFPGQYPNASERLRNKARVEAARTGC